MYINIAFSVTLKELLKESKEIFEISYFFNSRGVIGPPIDHQVKGNLFHSWQLNLKENKEALLANCSIEME